MPVGQVSSQDLQKQLQAMNTENVKQYKNLLCDHIRAIKNKAAPVNEEIKGKQNQLHLLNETLSTIKKLKNEHGKNGVIRLKNGTYKNGDSSSFFKRVTGYQSNRIENERKAAAAALTPNGNSKSITTLDAEESVSSDVLAITEEINRLEESKPGGKGNLEKQQIKLETVESVLSNRAKKEEAIAQQKKESYENHCILWHTNAGCKALNETARSIYRREGNKASLHSYMVIDEYERNIDKIFARGNAHMKDRIHESCVGDASAIVETFAKELYVPSKNSSTTYRGQGMTSAGIKRLIENHKKSPQKKYVTGQFFATSKKEATALDFTGRDAVKVLFQVKGNSSQVLSLPNGLEFHGSREDERLYSPLANFKVTDIKLSGGLYRVNLVETNSTGSAEKMPY